METHGGKGTSAWFALKLNYMLMHVFYVCPPLGVTHQQTHRPYHIHGCGAAGSIPGGQGGINLATLQPLKAEKWEKFDRLLGVHWL